jgi:hypothetical protein
MRLGAVSKDREKKKKGEEKEGRPNKCGKRPSA